ncbi:hypothetical protein [Streptomyces sp. NPDC056682]|uniref:hypothetical protein n=1 Tax=Streptomyces sp. NPDC056682 TaxID=3345909 RepID=UPI0036B58D7C
MPETVTILAEPANAWPEDVIARYLTLAGATVDLFRANPESTYIDSGHCTGCGHLIDWTAEEFGRKEAQRHAEKCRALPRPEGS